MAGPPGANGLSAYQLWLAAGNVGTEAEYLSSLVGAPGATGPQGDTGPRGAPGVFTGLPGADGASTPIGFFTGAQFSPESIGGAADAIVALQDSRVLKLGQVPFTTGKYLVHASVQLGWSGEVLIDLNGNLWLDCSPVDGVYSNTILTWNWCRIKRGTEGYNYGTVQSYDLCAIVTLTQGRYLSLQAGGDFFLVGGSLTAYALPQHVVYSPGFTDGLFQKTFSS